MIREIYTSLRYCSLLGDMPKCKANTKVEAKLLQVEVNMHFSFNFSVTFHVKYEF